MKARMGEGDLKVEYWPVYSQMMMGNVLITLERRGTGMWKDIEGDW